MKKGTFVTARLKGKEDCRQGVFVKGTPEEFLIMGESGTVYKCEGAATIVPDCNLRGNTKIFVMTYRNKEEIIWTQ